MYIRQKQLDNLRQFLSPGKVVVLYGARRTGKTTLVEEFLKEVKEPFLFVSGDDITVQEFLSSRSVEKLKAFVGASRLLIVDEAQRIRDIGLNLKIIVDHIAGIRVVAPSILPTASASH
jgi:predicted AAA+ superfamily ATPase